MLARRSPDGSEQDEADAGQSHIIHRDGSQRAAAQGLERADRDDAQDHRRAAEDVGIEHCRLWNMPLRVRERARRRYLRDRLLAAQAEPRALYWRGAAEQA